MLLKECDGHEDDKKVRSRVGYRFSFTKRQLNLTLTGITFVFILVFVLGFLVGKGFLEDRPVKMKDEGAAKGGRDEKDTFPIKNKRGLKESPSDSELTFFKTLVRKEGASSTKTAAVKTSPRILKYRNKEKRVFKKGADKSISLSGYTLQVGSFQDKKRAEKLINRLRSKGYRPYILSSNIPMKGVWHRVRTGHFQTLEDAKRFGSAFEMKERLPAFVTFISSKSE